MHKYLQKSALPFQRLLFYLPSLRVFEFYSLGIRFVHIVVNNWEYVTDFKETLTKGSHHMRKTVKKADNVRFGRPPPPKRVKSGHLLSEKARNLRQMRFRDKTAFFWGLGYC